MNKLLQEDCITGIKTLPSQHFDIIIADPPYNIGKDFGNNKTQQPIKQYQEWCKQWIDECIRVLKDTGTLYIYGWSENLSFIRVLVQCNVRWLVWHYTNKTVPSLKGWQRSHESILCCTKGKAVFNTDRVREPYTQSYKKNCAGKTRKATKGRFGQKETQYNANPKGALPRDTIKVPALAGGAGKKERVDHPTQKPLELTRKLFQAAYVPEGRVLIPFAGSGTEVVVAKEMEMQYIAYEINPQYCSLIEERLTKID